MSVAVEILEGLKRQVTLKLNADEVKSETAKRLQNIARRAKIDGYRPGKVPMKVVERNYGAQTEHEIVTDLLNAKYLSVVKDNSLKSAGYPDIQKIEGSEYEFNAFFDVMPEFELKDFDKIELVRHEADVTDADVDSMIETLRQQRTTWLSVDRMAEQGDRVTIDFEGTMDGVAFDGGSAKNTPVILGAGGMIPGFESALVGKKTGETVVFPVTFPEDYRAENLKGKAAEFTAVIHLIEAPQLPVIDTDFIQSFGVPSGELIELKAELKRNMVRELGNNILNAVKDQLMTQLVLNNPILLPESMVMREIIQLMERSQLPKPQNPEQAEQLFNIAKQAFSAEAEKRVRLGLLLAKFVEDENIKLDAAYLEARINLAAATYEDPETVKAHFKTDEEMMASLKNAAFEDQLVDLFMEKVKVTVEKTTFDAIMKSAKN